MSSTSNIGQAPGGDSWKELADRISKSTATNDAQVGLTSRKMIARLNERSPLATASGILDNGCGTGTVISYILETYGTEIPESAKILATDYSEPMLKKLRDLKQAKTSEGEIGWERLKLHNLDAHDLSTITDGSISHVTAGHLYFLLSDYRQALKETYRVLNRGGILALSGVKDSQHLDALHNAVEAIRPGTNLRLVQGPWASEAGVKNELELAGFVDVETFLVPSELRYATHEDFASMLLLMPIMKNAVEGYGEDEKKRLLVELVENLRSRNSSEPGVLTGTSMVALGRKG